MDELRPIGPRRVREMLISRSSTLVIPFEALASEESGYALAGMTSGTTPGVALPGGEAGVGRLVGDAIAGFGSEGRFEDEAVYRISLPDKVLSWIADPVILWRTLAGVYGAGQVEVTRVTSEDLAETLASPGEQVWHCRMENIGWIVLEGAAGGDRDDRAKRTRARFMHRMREVFRGLGLREAEITMEPRPSSVVSPGVTLLRLAGPDRVAFWPVAAMNRLLRRIVGGYATNQSPDGFPANGSVTLQRAAAVCICDYLIRTGGIGALTLAFPRTFQERRGRFAVRTVTELIRAGGVAPRVLADTAYRSGAHYRALATVLPGIARADRNVLRRALGRRRWEQLIDHSERNAVAPVPWVAFTEACEVLIQDLADRLRRPGASPPAGVGDIVRRHYSGPRDERLHAAWRRRIESGTLERALEEALLSHLRPLIRRLPWDVLVRAGCGDSHRVKMRISAAYSRRGRAMYLEDVAALEARVHRREMIEWDMLLAARRAVGAAVYASSRRTIARA